MDEEYNDQQQPVTRQELQRALDLAAARGGLSAAQEINEIYQQASAMTDRKMAEFDQQQRAQVEQDFFAADPSRSRRMAVIAQHFSELPVNKNQDPLQAYRARLELADNMAKQGLAAGTRAMNINPDIQNFNEPEPSFADRLEGAGFYSQISRLHRDRIKNPRP